MDAVMLTTYIRAEWYYAGDAISASNVADASYTVVMRVRTKEQAVSEIQLPVRF